MPQEVQVGTILLMSECPQLLGLESEPYSGDWRVVKALDGFALDRKIRAAGWNFFFIASEAKAIFFGAPGTKKIGHALTRILGKVSHQHFNALEVTIKSGRAVVFPIYKSTFERGDAMKTDEPSRTDFYREHVFDWYKDLARTLDYIQTRSDLDSNRIAYYGLSWGAALGPIFSATEPRIKTALWVGGGFEYEKTLPEVDPFNFTPRVKMPVLMVNGRYDFFFPKETTQDPMFRVLGTPEKDKRHVVFESGHVPPADMLIKEVLDWLDHYLGPVR